MIAKTINVRLPEALYNQSEALAHDVPGESWQIRDIQKGIKEAGAGEFASDKQVNSVFAKDALHNSTRVGAARIGMGCKAQFAANSACYWQ